MASHGQGGEGDNKGEVRHVAQDCLRRPPAHPKPARAGCSVSRKYRLEAANAGPVLQEYPVGAVLKIHRRPDPANPIKGEEAGIDTLWSLWAANEAVKPTLRGLLACRAVQAITILLVRR